jgi:hypothetical protein
MLRAARSAGWLPAASAGESRLSSGGSEWRPPRPSSAVARAALATVLLTTAAGAAQQPLHFEAISNTSSSNTSTYRARAHGNRQPSARGPILRNELVHAGNVTIDHPYGNPFVGPCLRPEHNVTIKGLVGGGRYCSPQCSDTHPCPVPWSPTDHVLTAQGECVLKIAPTESPNGCVLICSPTANQSDDGCPVGATCKPISGTGICTFDLGGTPSPAPPHPAPPPPSPAPPPTGPHYADPIDGPCTGGDVNMTVARVAGAACAPTCSDKGQACPTGRCGVSLHAHHRSLHCVCARACVCV